MALVMAIACSGLSRDNKMSSIYLNFFNSLHASMISSSVEDAINKQHKKYFHQIRQNSNTYKQKVIAKIDHTITISKLVSNIAWKGSQFSEKYIYPISGRKIVLGTLFHYEMLLRNENLRGTKSLNSNDSTGIPGFTNLANLCAV